MNSRTWCKDLTRLMVIGVLSFSTAGCGNVQGLFTTPTSTAASTPTPTNTPTVTNTPTSTNTPSATQIPTRTPTTTPSPTLAPTPLPPTATLNPLLPKYSQIVQTYPKGVRLCSTDAFVVGASDSGWLLNVEPPGGIEIINSEPQIQCYGTKLTLQVPVTVNGKTFQTGAKLTVDKDLNWVEVSSWN